MKAKYAAAVGLFAGICIAGAIGWTQAEPPKPSVVERSDAAIRLAKKSMQDEVELNAIYYPYQIVDTREGPMLLSANNGCSFSLAKGRWVQIPFGTTAFTSATQYELDTRTRAEEEKLKKSESTNEGK